MFVLCVINFVIYIEVLRVIWNNYFILILELIFIDIDFFKFDI